MNNPTKQVSTTRTRKIWDPETRVWPKRGRCSQGRCWVQQAWEEASWHGSMRPRTQEEFICFIRKTKQTTNRQCEKPKQKHSTAPLGRRMTEVEIQRDTSKRNWHNCSLWLIRKTKAVQVMKCALKGVTLLTEKNIHKVVIMKTVNCIKPQRMMKIIGQSRKGAKEPKS